LLSYLDVQCTPGGPQATDSGAVDSMAGRLAGIQAPASLHV